MTQAMGKIKNGLLPVVLFSCAGGRIFEKNTERLLPSCENRSDYCKMLELKESTGPILFENKLNQLLSSLHRRRTEKCLVVQMEIG